MNQTTVSNYTQLGMGATDSNGCVDAKPDRTIEKELKKACNNTFFSNKILFKGMQRNCECLFLGEGDIACFSAEPSLLQLGPLVFSNRGGHLLAVIQVKRCGLVFHKILIFRAIPSFGEQEPTPNDIGTCDCDSPLYLYATIEIKGLWCPRASYRLVTGSSQAGKPVLSEPSDKKSSVVFRIVVDSGTIANFIERT